MQIFVEVLLRSTHRSSYRVRYVGYLREEGPRGLFINKTARKIELFWRWLYWTKQLCPFYAHRQWSYRLRCNNIRCSHIVFIRAKLLLITTNGWPVVYSSYVGKYRETYFGKNLSGSIHRQPSVTHHVALTPWSRTFGNRQHTTPSLRKHPLMIQ